MSGRITLLEERIGRLEKAISPFASLPALELDDTATVRNVLRFVSYQTGLAYADLVGPDRGRSVFRGRAMVVWISREILGLSWEGIGRRLGGRDHSTIIKAFRRAEQLLERDPAFRLLARRGRAQFSKEKLNG